MHCSSLLQLCAHPLLFEFIRAAGQATRVSHIDDKSLSLRPASSAVSSSRSFDCALLLHFLWLAPSTIAVVVALLIVEVGVAAVAGLGVLILLAPCQVYISRWAARMRREMAQYADQRVKLITEVQQSRGVKSTGEWTGVVWSGVERAYCAALRAIWPCGLIESYHLVCLLVFSLGAKSRIESRSRPSGGSDETSPVALPSRAESDNSLRDAGGDRGCHHVHRLGAGSRCARISDPRDRGIS
jgi:hypothetical protein